MLGSRPLFFNLLWFKNERLVYRITRDPLKFSQIAWHANKRNLSTFVYEQRDTMGNCCSKWKESTKAVEKSSVSTGGAKPIDVSGIRRTKVWPEQGTKETSIFYQWSTRPADIENPLKMVGFKTKHDAVWFMSNIDRASRYTFPYLNLCCTSHDEFWEHFDRNGQIKPGFAGLNHQPHKPVAARLLASLLHAGVRLGPHVGQLDGFPLQVGHQVANLRTKKGYLVLTLNTC